MRRITTMRKQSLSIISAFMISAVLLTGCGDTAPVLDNATPETTEASETAASETEVSDAAPEETTDTTSVESTSGKTNMRCQCAARRSRS